MNLAFLPLTHKIILFYLLILHCSKKTENHNLNYISSNMEMNIELDRKPYKS